MDDIIYLEAKNDNKLPKIYGKNDTEVLIWLLKNFKVGLEKPRLKNENLTFFKNNVFNNCQLVLWKNNEYLNSDGYDAFLFMNVQKIKDTTDVNALNELVTNYLKKDNEIKPIIFIEDILPYTDTKKESLTNFLSNFILNVDLINDQIKNKSFTNNIQFDAENSNLVFWSIEDESYKIILLYNNTIFTLSPAYSLNQLKDFIYYNEESNLSFDNFNITYTYKDYDTLKQLTQEQLMETKNINHYLKLQNINDDVFYPIYFHSDSILKDELCSYNDKVVQSLIARSIFHSLLNTNILINQKNKFLYTVNKNEKHNVQINIMSDFTHDDRWSDHDFMCSQINLNIKMNYNLFQLYDFRNSDFDFYLVDDTNLSIQIKNPFCCCDLKEFFGYLSSATFLYNHDVIELAKNMVVYANNLFNFIIKLNATKFKDNLSFLKENNLHLTKIIPDFINKDDPLTSEPIYINKDTMKLTSLEKDVNDLLIFKVYKPDSKINFFVSIDDLLNKDIKEITQKIKDKNLHNYQKMQEAETRAKKLLDQLEKNITDNQDENVKMRR